MDEPTLTLEQRIALYPNYAKMIAVVKDAKAVNEWLMEMPVYELCEEYRSPEADAYRRPINIRPPTWCAGAVRIADSVGYRFVDNRGWEKYECVRCAVWLVPSKYIGLREGPFIEAFLKKRFKYLEGFKIFAYGLSGDAETQEVYIKTEADTPYGNLYCPIEAFFKGNSKIIIDRTVGYLKEYLGFGDLRTRFPPEIHAYAAVRSSTAKKLFAEMATWS